MRSALRAKGRAAARRLTHPDVFRIEDLSGTLDAAAAGTVIAAEPEPHREPFPPDPHRLYRLQHRPEEIEFPRAQVMAIDGARVASPLGVVSSGSNLVLWRGHGVDDAGARATYARASPTRLRRAMRLREPALCLSHTTTSNYYHFVVDISTQLAVCAALGVGVERVVVWDGITPWQQAILETYGVGQAAVAAPPDGAVEFDRLLLASPINVKLSPADNVWFYRRDLLLQHAVRIAGVPPPGGSRRLFLGRRGEWRTITNREPLSELVEAAGFEEIDPGTLSFHEQVEVFGEAEAIIAAHGAALTNILFAPTTCRIAEFRTEYSPCYAHVAAHRGQDHTPLPTEPVGNDYAVSLGAVEGWLDSLSRSR